MRGQKTLNELLNIINTTNPLSAVGFVANTYHDFDKKLHRTFFRSKCIKDCNYCCYDYFYISEAEFYTIAYYLFCYKDKTFINNIKQKGYRQYQALSKIYPDEITYLSKYVPIQQYQDNIMKFRPDQKNMRLDVSCPFLINGVCSIYPVRPFVCRAYGTETGEHISKCNNVKYRGNFNYDKTDVFLKIITFTFGNNIIVKRYPLFYFFTHLTNTTFWNNIQKILELATNQIYDQSIHWHDVI